MNKQHLDDNSIVRIGNAVQGHNWCLGITQMVHDLIVYLRYITFMLWKSKNKKILVDSVDLNLNYKALTFRSQKSFRVQSRFCVAFED